MHAMKDFEAIASFGQYLHWSQMQYEHFRTYDENSADAAYIGALILWLASLYVVIDGWKELGKSDAVISELLDRYDDYYQLMRRFRNAVYHFQPTPLCEKLTNLLSPQSEVHPWATALQFEFQRVLCSMVPTAEIGEELRRTIGWWPSETLIILKAQKTQNMELNPSLRFLTRLFGIEPATD